MGRLGSRQRQLKRVRPQLSIRVSADVDDGRSVAASSQQDSPNSNEFILLDDSIEEADLEKMLDYSLKWQTGTGLYRGQ